MPIVNVTLCADPFDTSTWTRHVVGDIHAFLQERFHVFPPDARIYHEQVAEANDVTPPNEAGIARLGNLGGHLYVVLYPAGPVAVVAAVVAVAAVAAVALAPDVPPVASPELNNQRQQSPNNQIAQRQNRPRIGSRIPDIFGTVRAFPDLLSVPYRRFVGNVEFEYSYMCLGRGEYDVDAESVREGATQLSQIGGTGVSIYDPFTSPNSDDNPYLTVGGAVDEPVARVDRAEGVNNQVLLASNAQGQVGTNNIMFQGPDLLTSSVSQDFTNKLSVGSEVTIGNAEVTVPLAQTATSRSVSLTDGLTARIYNDQGINVLEFRGTAAQIQGRVSEPFNGDPGDMVLRDVIRVRVGSATDQTQVLAHIRIQEGNSRVLFSFVGATKWPSTPRVVSSGSVRFDRGTSVDLDFGGTYTIEALADRTIKFVIARASSRAPSAIATPLDFRFAVINVRAADRTTPATNATISGDINRWVGPFTVESADRLVANFVARSGLYSDDGTQRPLEVEVEIEAREIRPDAPTGGQPTTFPNHTAR